LERSDEAEKIYGELLEGMKALQARA